MTHSEAKRDMKAMIAWLEARPSPYWTDERRAIAKRAGRTLLLLNKYRADAKLEKALKNRADALSAQMH